MVTGRLAGGVAACWATNTLSPHSVPTSPASVPFGSGRGRTSRTKDHEAWLWVWTTSSALGAQCPESGASAFPTGAPAWAQRSGRARGVAWRSPGETGGFAARCGRETASPVLQAGTALGRL